jgi:NAD-dependent dihydropyrimidine dehydrogenase PreA subunit
MSLYRSFLNKYGLPDLPEVDGLPEVIRTQKRDIENLGKLGLRTIANIGDVIAREIESCTSCLSCITECPGMAISTTGDDEPVMLILDSSMCNGTACRHCERVCPVGVFKPDDFFKLGLAATRKRK